MNSLKELSDLGIDWETVKNNYQILIIPSLIEESNCLVNNENIATLIDTDDSIHLCKLLKLENISCANSYDLRLDSKVSHLRSGQIELGIIWVLDKVCLPILIGVIGRIIGDKIINRLKSKNDELEKINTQIEIKIVDDNLSIISIKHNGDAEKLMKILEGLKND